MDSIFANVFEILKVLAVLFIIGIIVGFFSLRKKKKRSKCDRCAKPYGYQDIAWKVINKKTGGTIFGNPKSKVTVAIACRCSSCGEIRRLTRKYTCAEYKKGLFGASVKEVNIEELVQRDFL